jgi:hypothetical protein
MGRPIFNWEINFGHLMTIATLIAAGFLAYLSIELRITDIDKRTADYPTVRDQVKAHQLAIMGIQSTLSDTAGANRSVVETLATIREDVAVIKATLEAERRAERTRLPQ